MKWKFSLILIMLIMMLTMVFICIAKTSVYGQSSGNTSHPPSPKEIKYEQPLIENKPDEFGKFKQNIPAPVDNRRLMNSNEQYPPPGIRNALMGLIVLMGVAVYFLFIHNNLKKMVPILGSLSGRIKGSMQKSVIPSNVSTAIEREKLSNEAIIMNMVIEIEKDKSEEFRERQFQSFSLGRAIPQRPVIQNLGIKDGESGLHVIMTDSPQISRAIAYNLIKQCSRLDQPLVFLSSRISTEEIAKGIIALETEKTWEAMDEQEKYRVTRQVEDFMEKYNGICSMNNLSLTGNEIQEIITGSKNRGKPTAVIIDDFSLQSESDWEAILENFRNSAKKDGIPVFIIDKTGNIDRWKSMKDMGFKSMLKASGAVEKVVIDDILRDTKAVCTVSVNSLNGKLETAVS